MFFNCSLWAVWFWWKDAYRCRASGIEDKNDWKREKKITFNFATIFNLNSDTIIVNKNNYLRLLMRIFDVNGWINRHIVGVFNRIFTIIGYDEYTTQ